MSMLSPLLKSRNSYYPFNWYKCQSALSKRIEVEPWKRTRSKVIICVIVIMIATVLCIIATICVVTTSGTTMQSKPNSNAVINTLPNSHTARLIDITNKKGSNESSTQYPPNIWPLRAPQIKSNFSSTELKTTASSHKKLANRKFIKETEYLLDRQDNRPQYYVNLPRKISQHNIGETTENISSFMHNQIPRPPRFKKMPLWKRQFDYSDNDDPRPFNYVPQNYGPQTFKKCNCSKDHLPKALNAPINNIQDILKQRNNLVMGEENPTGALQITGKYRHPRGEGMRNMFKKNIKRRNNIARATKLQLHTNKNSLNSYKPRSPVDINMLLNREYKLMRPGGQWKYNVGRQSFEYSEEDNTENMNSDSQGQKMKNNSKTGTAQGKRKPFSLMLDIYPIGENEQTPPTAVAQQQPLRTSSRRPYIPLPPGPGHVNNLPYTRHLDASYYNTIQFPQMQQQKYPQSTNYYDNQLLSNYKQSVQAYSSNPVENPSQHNPSQVMVHLNLYPKEKPKRQHRLLGELNDVPESGISNETIAKMDYGGLNESQIAEVVRSGREEPYQPLFTAESKIPAPVYERDIIMGPYDIRFHAPQVTIQQNPEEMIGNKGEFKVPETVLQFHYTDAVVMTPQPI